MLLKRKHDFRLLKVNNNRAEDSGFLVGFPNLFTENSRYHKNLLDHEAFQGGWENTLIICNLVLVVMI